MQEVKELWEKVVSKLELLVSVVSFDMWFRPLEVLDFKDNVLYLCANTSYAKTQIAKNHSVVMTECLQSVFGEDIKFEIIGPEEKEDYLKKNMPAEDLQASDNSEDSQFNEKYTFDNFVVGKSNQFVYAAARSVAENPGERFNPLFIYGGVGLGKTHLLNAIGNYIKTHSPNKKIKYVTCDKFTNDYIDSLRAGKEKEKANVEFRRKYRDLDVLMIDDIQFISNKTSTQEEFFNTFNELYQKNKQIIISSDRHPKEIATLADRLSSRLLSGLTQDIQAPDFETKLAILKKKVSQERYIIDDDVLTFIAEKVNTNIREMEGILSKIYFYATLTGKKHASMDDAREIFQDKEEEQKEQISPDAIIEKVCTYYGINTSDITGKRKSKECVEPRMIAIYLIVELLNMPLVSVGKLFGGRDHTTIIHSRDKISEQLKTNNKIRTIVGEIKNQISSGCWYVDNKKNSSTFYPHFRHTIFCAKRHVKKLFLHNILYQKKLVHIFTFFINTITIQK